MRKYISVLITVLLLVILVFTFSCKTTEPETSQEPLETEVTTSTTTQPESGTQTGTATTTTTTTTPTAEKPIELRFADHNPPTGRISVKFIEPWAREIEKATDGRVKVTMYFGETLCKGTESLPAVIGGITDLAWVVHGFFPGRFPLSSVMQLPFISAPEAEYEGRRLSPAAVNSLIFQELYENLPEVQAEYSDVKLLYNHVSMPYFLITVDEPVRNRDDLQGMKLRELGGPPTEMWKLLGANPMLLSAPDIYESAEKGIIDGAASQWSMIGTFRFYEVFDYWTEMGTTMSIYSVVMNKDRWNSLPADIQEDIMSVSGKWGAEYGGSNAYGFELQDSVMQVMKDEGYDMEKITLDPGEMANWKSIAGQPLWDSWVADRDAEGLDGQKVLDEALRLVDKYSD